MLNGLDHEYDVIIVGSGMVESIIAAACARIGKTVFHVDTNDYYGSDWTSFTLNNLIEWIEAEQPPTIKINSENDNEEIIPIGNPLNVFRNRKLQWFIEKNQSTLPTDEKNTTRVTLDIIQQQTRKFNIDLIAKLHYSSGELIDLLVQSNIAKYCEFKLVSRLLFENNGQLDDVPSSRADIFNSNDISLVEKRSLMKVIMNLSSMSIEDLKEDENIPFIDYLQKQKLNDRFCHLIINSISIVDYKTTTKEGIMKAKQYLSSVGRYGNSPFLYPLYGNGEMTQCFCRLCAVFGGVYFLKFPLAGLTVDIATGECSGIISSAGERFRARDAVICNNSYMESIRSHENAIHRMVLITDQSIKSSDKEEITYLRLGKPHEPSFHVIEVGNGTGCTPDGFFLLYIFFENSSFTDEEIIERLLSVTGDYFKRDNILGMLTFDQIETLSTSSSSPVSKLILAHGPDGSIDHSGAVKTAESIFKQIYPDIEKFLERAPDPEDIIVEHVDNTTGTNDSSSSP